MQHHFSQNMMSGFNDRRDSIVATMYKSYYLEIVGKVKKLTGGSPDSVDLASEIITRLLEQPTEFKTLRNLENYIRQVTFTVCHDEMQRKNTVKKNVYQMQKYHQDLEDRAKEKLHNYLICQKLTSIAAEMLPARTGQVYILAYVYGLKNREIAERLKISESTVENHKNTAFKKLRIEINNRQGVDGRIFLFILSIPLIIDYLLLQKLLS